MAEGARREELVLDLFGVNECMKYCFICGRGEPVLHLFVVNDELAN